MAIDEKDLDEFLSEPPKEGDIPDEIRKVLDRIWERNDSLTWRGASGYISKRKAAEFFRTQGIVVGKEKLVAYARDAGRFSWDRK